MPRSFVLDALLEDDLLALVFDGLKRIDEPSNLGEFHYVPMMFHEGRKVGKEQRLLLEVHGLLLSQFQGRSPAGVRPGSVRSRHACEPVRSLET